MAEFLALKEKRDLWTDMETFALINVWSDFFGALKKSKRNSIILARMCVALEAQHGIVKSRDKIKVKIHNLSQLYRKEKSNMAHGGSLSSWKFWAPMHEMIENFNSQNSSEKGDGYPADNSISEGECSSGQYPDEPQSPNPPVPPTGTKFGTKQPMRPDNLVSCVQRLVDSQQRLERSQERFQQTMTQSIARTQKLLEKQVAMQEEEVFMQKKLFDLLERYFTK